MFDGDPYDEASRLLVDAVGRELGPWMERRMVALAPHLGPDARRIADETTAEVVVALEALMVVDIDLQRGTPLGIVRRAIRRPTDALRAAGVPPVRRDPWVTEAEPDDIYDLVPATWADFGPASAEAGLVWGAAKAMRHLARHRPPAD